MSKATQFTQQFKEDAVRYKEDHPELSYEKAAMNLGVSSSALKSWVQASRKNNGSVPTRGSGNYSSDEEKEIARLQRELRDTKDALEILKKAIGILGN
jgi:transposase